LGSYKQLSNAFGTTTDRAGNVVAGATLPTADAVRRGQLTARIAGQNAQLSDVLGTKVDRLGNVIAAPAMPAFFKDGGEVTGGSPSLDEYLKQQMIGDQDSGAALFDNAQKLMSDFNEVPKVEPMRKMVKRVSRGSGGDSKTDKNMSIKVPPLAASKGMAFNLPSAQEAAQTTNMGSAREQMEELARVYQLKINAAKNKARGLGADTFGAPTLEGPTLVKKSLTKQRFAKGGEVKNEEVAEPSLFGVSDYATKVSARMFPDQLGQDDQRDAARHMLAAGSVARKYGPKAADLLGKAHERMSNPQSFFSMFGIGQPRDDLPYDVHNNRIGAELAARATSQAELEKLVQAMALQAQTKQTKDKPYIMSREQLQARKEKAQKGPAERPQGYQKGGMVKALKGTKAVDKEGSPVMAYRGEYGPSDRLSTELGSYSFGTKDAANLYATDPNKVGNVTEAMKVFPAQLSIRKPLVNAPGDAFIDLPILRKALGKKEFDRVVRENADRIEGTNAFEELADAKGYTSVLDLIKKNPKDLDNLATQLYPILDDPRSVKALQRRGYDGAIYGGSGATGGEPEYRVFSASQAVSPYGNQPMAPRSARQQLSDIARSMDVSPTDALEFFGRSAGVAGAALTPSSLNQGEAEELARRRSMPPTIDRANGSPEEGEVSQAELEAASKPAFVTPKSGKGRKSSSKAGELEAAALQGVSETPYNLLGAPVDLATMAMRPFGYDVQAPMLGSEDLKRRATKAGIRQEPPKEGTAARALYNLAEVGSSAVNPAAPVRAGVKAAKAVGDKATDVARDFQEYNRQLDVPGASYAVAPKGGKSATPLFSPLPSAQAPFVGRLDRFVAELPGAVQKDQFLGMLKGKFRDHEIGRAREALEDLDGAAKVSPSDLLNRIKQDYDPARYRTQIVEPEDGAFYSTMDNPYQGRPMGVIHLIQDADPIKAAKEASAIDTFDSLVSGTYGTMGRSDQELINQYNNIKQALEGARVPNLSAVKRAFVPYAKASRARMEFSDLQDTLVYPNMSDSYKSYLAEAQKTYGNDIPKEVSRQLENRVMAETAEKMATKYGMQELVAQIPDYAKNRHLRRDFSPLYDGAVAENVEAMISATNATLRDTLRDRSSELRQSLNNATPTRADSYRGQHSTLRNDPNPISFSRFTEHTTDIPGMGATKGIYVHELQSDRLDDIRKSGPLGGSGKKDYEERLMPLETEHAKVLQEYMALREKNPSSPDLAEKKKTLATLDRKRNAMLERVMSGKYALKESFPGMEDSPQVIQQLMAKNAVAGAIDRGANFVAFPGAESAQAQLYEKLPNNLKQVVKDLGPGFEYRSVTLRSSDGKDIMHPAIVWGPEGVAKTKKEGIPFKKGGMVDKNTAFIQAHS
jgi:hypothetical protein